MNLRARLFLLLIGLVTTLVVLAVVMTNQVVVGEAKRRMAQQLAAAEPLYRSVWETRTRLLVGAIESIAGTDYVKRVLGLLYASPDPAAARETVRDLARELLGRQLDQADLLFVADGAGRIVVADTLKAPQVRRRGSSRSPRHSWRMAGPLPAPGFCFSGSGSFNWLRSRSSFTRASGPSRGSWRSSPRATR